mgnify:CR=1 FL=1
MGQHEAVALRPAHAYPPNSTYRVVYGLALFVEALVYADKYQSIRNLELRGAVFINDFFHVPATVISRIVAARPVGQPRIRIHHCSFDLERHLFALDTVPMYHMPDREPCAMDFLYALRLQVLRVFCVIAGIFH